MSFIEDYELTKNPKDLQLHTMEKRIIELEAERDKALKYAIDLATSLVKQHYPHVPYWEPDDNLYGVLMQIDNATTRWKKDVLKLEAENDRLKEALHEAVRLLREGKRLFAPNTMNSDVDYFLGKHSIKALGGEV